MKLTILTTLFSIGLFLFVLNPGFTDEVEMESYVNEDLGYAVEYPSSWFVDDSIPESLTISSSEGFDSEDFFGGAFGIGVVPIDALGISTLEEASNLFSALMAEEGDITGDFESTTLDGVEGVTTSFSNPGEDMAGEIRMFINFNLFYLIAQFVTPPEVEKDYIPVFETMLASIKLFEPSL